MIKRWLVDGHAIVEKDTTDPDYEEFRRIQGHLTDANEIADVDFATVQAQADARRAEKIREAGIADKYELWQVLDAVLEQLQTMRQNNDITPVASLEAILDHRLTL